MKTENFCITKYTLRNTYIINVRGQMSFKLKARLYPIYVEVNGTIYQKNLRKIFLLYLHTYIINMQEVIYSILLILR